MAEQFVLLWLDKNSHGDVTLSIRLSLGGNGSEDVAIASKLTGLCLPDWKISELLKAKFGKSQREVIRFLLNKFKENFLSKPDGVYWFKIVSNDGEPDLLEWREKREA